MAYNSGRTGRDNRRGTYSKRSDTDRRRYGAGSGGTYDYGSTGQSVNRDPYAPGSTRPSRYGLSSPVNFPPARSPRSPGGISATDSPDFYEEENGGFQSRDSTRKNRKDAPSHTSRLAHGAGDVRDGELDQAELDRLYRIATGQKEPRFRDAFREGPWEGHVLRRRAFFLCLAECAVYALCFRLLLTPLTVLTARLGPLSAPATAALVSLAGSLACALFWPVFRERRMLYCAWGWLSGAALVVILLSQVLLWGEAQAQWTVLRFAAFFFLGPVAANGALSCGLLYLHWRGEHPLPKPVQETDEEE